MPRQGEPLVDVREVKFTLDMSWHADKEQEGVAKGRKGRITVEDNGWGQDQHGVQGMAKIGQHIDKEGHSGAKIGKYGFGFNGESLHRRVRTFSLSP